MRRHPPPRLLWALLGAALAPGALADAPISEATMKAAFVYNFVKFVNWPAQAPGAAPEPVKLCLIGSQDPFLAALKGIDGKSAQNRTIAVRRLGPGAELRGCHILAIAESESGRLPELVRAAAEHDVLTVAEIQGFIDAGGTIGLVVDRNKVHFEINLESARQANLGLSSHLLKLARRVLR